MVLGPPTGSRSQVMIAATYANVDRCTPLFIRCTIAPCQTLFENSMDWMTFCSSTSGTIPISLSGWLALQTHPSRILPRLILTSRSFGIVPLGSVPFSRGMALVMEVEYILPSFKHEDVDGEFVQPFYLPTPFLRAMLKHMDHCLAICKLSH